LLIAEPIYHSRLQQFANCLAVIHSGFDRCSCRF